jgi:hypothetical protein
MTEPRIIDRPLGVARPGQPVGGARGVPHPLTEIDVAVRATIVGLTLTTGFIHATLGGMLFTLNALGFGVAAVAMIVPLGIAVRFRWLVRLGLIGYAGATIVGWFVMGPRYEMAYLAKGVEVLLIGLLAIDFARRDGNPIDVVRRALGR